MPTRADSVWKSQHLDDLTPATDQFGHLDYAETISSVLNLAKPPFTLGLYGPWGVGKTLIIKAACEQIKDGCAYVIYDAWRYDGDTLRRHFLRDVAKSLERDGELTNYDVDEKLKTLDVQTAEPKDVGYQFDLTYLLIVLGGLGVLMALGAAVLGLFFDAHKLWAWLVGIGGGVLALAIASVISPFARVIKVAQVTEVRDRVVDPEVFTAKFIELLEHVKKKRLVVAIDNLDRCSPERVTELLETLNTYLEPAGRKDKTDAQQARSKGADAVFLVAADDGALRRHIESKEAKRSEGFEHDPHLRADVGGYADEYLRKIFTATIPIKPALSTELRVYVAKQTASLVKDREIAPQDHTRLVEVIAEGLKRNPRRVTQFVRNLELRLLLLAERHQSEKMADDLSASEHVPFVAKLLVLEEEWPAAYGALDADRALLAKWHEQQAAQVWASDESSGDVNADSKGDFHFAHLNGLSGSQTRQFAAFLGVTRSVQSKQLSAFLSLKQSKHEVDLPRFADFRDALLNSDSQALAEIATSIQPAEMVAYAKTLVDIGNEHSQYPDTVRAIVETAVNDESLREHAHVELTDLLQWALNDPSRRSGLRVVPADKMLPLAATLSDPDFNAVVRLYVSDEGNEPMELPSEALAALPAGMQRRFESLTTILIRKALTTDEAAKRPDAILRVLDWWPGAATSELAVASTARFADDEAAASVEASILKICLETIWKPDAARTRAGIASDRDSILDAVRARITVFFDTTEPSSVDERCETVAGMIPLVQQLAGEIHTLATADRAELMTPLGAALDQARPAMNDDRLVEPILDLVGAIAEIGSDEFVQVMTNVVQQFLVQRPAMLAEYAVNRADAVPSQLVPVIAQALDGIVRAADDQDALSGLIALDPVDETQTLKGALTHIVTGGRYDFLEEAIGTHPDELDRFRHALAVTALGSGDDGGTLFALGQSDTLDAEQLDLLEEKVVGLLVELADDDPDEATALMEGLESTALAPKLDSIVNQLWDEAKPHEEPPVDLIGLIATYSGRLERVRKVAFVDGVEEWFREGAGRELAELLADADLKAGDRKRFVEAILSNQASGRILAHDHATRASLFKAADEIAGTNARSAARKLVDDAREALNSDSSPPDDKDVFKLLNADDH